MQVSTSIDRYAWTIAGDWSWMDNHRSGYPVRPGYNTLPDVDLYAAKYAADPVK